MIESRKVHNQVWGVLGQFSSSKDLLAAVTSLQDAGHERLEAYSPFPIEGLAEQLKLKRTKMPWVILCGGILGGSSAYALEYWVNLYAYPLNIGGRPLHSWPSFITPMFEGAVLLASLFAVVGVILICGLPRLHHPLFELEAFKRASTDGFFLAVRSQESQSATRQIEQHLKAAGALHVWEVPNV